MPVHSLARRSFLSAASTLLTGCAMRGVRTPPASARLRLAPVNVAENRVIRTICGLRPFRPSGFVVKRESFGPKTLIHNYGHGGAGITLAWGTGELAVEHALASGQQQFAVLGGGVIGLTTAVLLQRAGKQVSIYTKALPPHTTSNIAGGWWAPVTVHERDKRTASYDEQFQRACRISYRRYQDLAGDAYGVRWLPTYFLNATERDFPQMMGLPDLFPAPRMLTPDENPFPAAHAQRFYSMLIEPAVFLPALLRDFLVAGGRIHVREFGSTDELQKLAEPAIVNCTGLGARALFQDSELVPIKGQLSFLLPQPEIDYCTVGPNDLYMFPRRDGILLGGTHDRGNWGLEPNSEDTRRILNGHRELFTTATSTRPRVR